MSGKPDILPSRRRESIPGAAREARRFAGSGAFSPFFPDAGWIPGGAAAEA